MGQRLILDLDDPLFDTVRAKPVGMSGGCYCCGRQLHIEYSNLNVLPNCRIDGELYSILICDDCEKDVVELEEDGIEDVSYDVLFHLQEDLQSKLNEVGEIHHVEEEDRFEILKQLYIEHEVKLRRLKG